MTEAAATPGLTRKKKLFLGAATALGIFLFLEILLQILSPSYPVRVRAPAAHAQVRAYLGRGELWSDTDVVELGFSIYEDDRRLLWRMRPGLDAELTNFLTPPAFRANTRFRVITDDRGYRSAPGAKASDRPLRVACLGDSHTFGWGIAGDEAYPAVLERELARLGLEAAVLNRGQPGFSTAQGRVLLEEVLARDEPQVVILAFGFNDSRQSDAADRDLMESRASMGGGARWAAGRLQIIRLARSLLPAPSALAPGSALVPRVSRPAFQANIAAMASACEKAGATVAFLSLYTGPLLAADLAAEARERDAVYLPGDAVAQTCAARLSRGQDEAAREAAARGRSAFGSPFLTEKPGYWIRVDAAHYSHYVHAAVARALAARLAPILKARAGR